LFSRRIEILFLCLLIFVSGLLGAPVETLRSFDQDSVNESTTSSVTFRNQRIADVPLSVFSFSRRERERYQLVDPEHIAMQTPGVSYNAPTGNVANRDMSMFGYQTKLIVDGIDFSSIIQGEAWGYQPFQLAGAETVEIIQGPNSLVYGGDAFGGTINYSISEAQEHGMHVKAYNYWGVGNNAFGKNATDLQVSGRRKKTWYKIGCVAEFSNVKTTSLPLSKLGVLDTVAENHNEHLSVFAKSGYSFNKSTSADIGLYANSAETKNVLGSGEGESIDYFLQNAAVLNVAHQVDSVNSVVVSGTFRSDEMNETAYSQYYGAPMGRSDATHSGASLQWHIDNPMIENYTVIGAGFASEHMSVALDSSEQNVARNLNLNAKEGYILIQTQQEFFQKRCYATISLRRDFNTRFVAPLTMRHSLSYRYSRTMTCTYSYSESYREPTIFEQEINPELLPERNSQQSISLLAKLYGFNFKISAYYSELGDLVGPVTDTILLEKKNVYPLMNRERSSYWGNEAECSFRADRYEYIYWFDLARSKDMEHVTPFRAGMRASADLTHYFQMSFLVHYSSKTRLYGNYYVQPWTVADVVLRLHTLHLWNWGQAECALSLKNIFDETPFSYKPLTGTTTSGSTPRSIWLSVGLAI